MQDDQDAGKDVIREARAKVAVVRTIGGTTFDGMDFVRMQTGKPIVLGWTKQQNVVIIPADRVDYIEVEYPSQEAAQELFEVEEDGE